ncbi:Histidinol-phosphate aminotransferase [Buchnera aphidicola (Pterocallis alni)]|uniref:histidinol-phosphate transaminase n=1 Tax=Buchnera aphidicola TaxID=9 RepID=UPI0034646383
MEKSIRNLPNKHIVCLKAYKSARSIGGKGDIWLNANELPVSIIHSLKILELNRYPEFQDKKLILKYSMYAGTDYANILISRGSDESIELLIRVFCDSKIDSVMTFTPTYSMYSKIAEIYNVNNIILPLLNNNNLDFKSIKLFLDQVKLIFICRPNNPTGYIIHIKDIIHILDITLGKSIVIIDEAYIEFNIHDSLSYLLKIYPNLVILRTLSKAFGLAGIRCGFALAHRDVILLLRKVITPYPLPIPTILIAIQSLNDSSIRIMQNRVLKINKNRLWLYNQLKNLYIVEKIFYSFANYILVKFFYSDYVFCTLWNKGIILRNQSHDLLLKGCIRISIGTKKECYQLIMTLRNII